MIAIVSESIHLCDKSVEISYDICLAPKLNTCRSVCARMNTCVKLLRVVNSSLSIKKFIFFLFIFPSKKKFPWLHRSLNVFFLHHGFPSLYNINFMVCLIMWACSSVIIEYFEANCCAYVRYGWIEITYVKANHCVAFLFVNVVELVYYIFCIFPRVDACL